MSLSVLGRYLVRQGARYAVGIGLLVATNACALLAPWITKDVIDALGAPAPGPGTGRIVASGALAILVLALVQGLLRSASRLTLLGAGQRVEAAIRTDLLAHLLRLEPAFFQARRTGDLMARATNDLQSVAMLVGFGFLSLVNTAIVYAGALAAMLRIDPWLTLWALAPYPLLLAIARRLNARAHADALAVQDQMAHVAARLQENLSGMPVVRAYTLEAREVADFRRLAEEYLARVLRQARTQGMYGPLLGVMSGIGSLIVLWVGGQAVLDGRLTLGTLVAFMGYVAYLAWPTMALGWVLALVRRGFSAMSRVVEILAVKPGVVDGPEAIGPVTIQGAIDVRSLTFAYGDGRGPALDGVTLHIPAGQSLAIVGQTGAGKTTLTALLVRLWDPPRGTVFIDGRDVHTIPLRDLRSAIAYVPQEAFLFSRTLRENVALGAADDAVADAADVAGLTPDLARLPSGWETAVGERGLSLSGGQRQRATLARALARDARILILDDVFAAVDAETEAAILAALRRRIQGRTTLAITHRLQAAAVMDRVVVLDEGRVVEDGRHEDLLRRGGPYARLWARQAMEGRLAGAGPEVR